MHLIRAHEFGTADVLRYVEDEPPKPGHSQVRVRLHAAGVNPADTYVITGTYAFLRPQVPFTPGWDGAGVVDAVGPGVTDLSSGQRVFVAALPLGSSGTYAEYVVTGIESVHPLPDSLTFEQGAAIGVPYLTAYRALFQRGGARVGETVLVHGASGGVGIPAVQLAVGAGLSVIGTAGSDAGQDLVRAQGAHHVLDHTRAGYLEEIQDLTHGRGVDLIVEMLANENLENDFDALARHGRIVVVGARGPVSFTPRKTMIAEADIRGTALWNMRTDEIAEAQAAVSRQLEDGTLKPVVGRTFPLAEAAEAQRYLMNRHAYGRVVLDCG
ncbi:NADPH:quinone reductase [Streptomyces chartreusis]|uniref:NADPH:quinone reductase n=1 Tax=Streptomyces chartreusis TaxID=1969 RepID=UPI0033AEF66A